RFSDIIGQETTVRTLQNAIESERIHHAYLFSGVRGVGKTTAARILAKALNCVNGPTVEPDNTCVICREITEGIDMDVREIDAATYTGVDNIRELREVTQFQPARDRYRIFIIDEAHMLSTGAWNALLKILEEPPPHVIFMFATTEVNKVPQTIISRVQKFQLRKITLEELIGRVGEISKAEGIETDRGAIEIIARRGEGSVRDSLSLLDQVIAFSGKSITAADVATVLGLSDTNFFARLVAKISEGDHSGILEALQEAADSGRDFKMLFRDLLSFIRNLLLIAGGAPESLLAASPEDLVMIRDAAERFSYSDLLRIANLLIRDDETVNKAEHQRLAVEIALLKAATFPRLKAVEAVLAGQSGGEGAAAPLRTTAPAATQKQDAGRIAGATPSTLDGLQQRIQKTKPLIASYLSHAKSAKKDGNRITWMFDDATYADYVKDAKTTIEQIASDVFGEPVTIEAIAEVVPPQSRRAEDKPSALRDDPVVRAFQKHLGADIVEGRRTK
ncbi:MAG TPA: DNA polymerase III subunit gamma/tau, partial [Thermoanaerobaculia bacterium]|nr:DNA polymerase III subunit gamma/tau [Thermoanaerobaculia bacterium]